MFGKLHCRFFGHQWNESARATSPMSGNTVVITQCARCKNRKAEALDSTTRFSVQIEWAEQFVSVVHEYEGLQTIKAGMT